MTHTAKLSIRHADGTDLEILVAGNRAMAQETEGLTLAHEVIQRGVATALGEDVDAFYVIAEDATGVAGQLMITREWSDWRAAWVWWIQSVYVWPRCRRQGVYAALHSWVRDRSRQAHAAGVRLYVDQRNTGAQRTYAAMGMDGGHYQVFEQMLSDEPRADKPRGGQPRRGDQD